MPRIERADNRSPPADPTIVGPADLLPAAAFRQRVEAPFSRLCGLDNSLPQRTSVLKTLAVLSRLAPASVFHQCQNCYGTAAALLEADTCLMCWPLQIRCPYHNPSCVTQGNRVS